MKYFLVLLMLIGLVILSANVYAMSPVELDLAGSQIGVTATLPLCTSDRDACSNQYTCDPAGWECDAGNIFHIDSPLKQIKSGIALVDVQCNDGKYPAIRYDRMRVACVSLDTESKLVTRGWATMRLAMPGDNISHALCNNYEGKWHPKYFGCRDISDLQCSLMGGEFVDDLSICENGICPDKLYSLCVTNQNLYMQYPNETEGDFHNRCGPSDTLRGPTPMPSECDSELIECTYVCGDTHEWLFFDEHGFEIDQSVAGMIVEQNEN